MVLHRVFSLLVVFPTLVPQPETRRRTRLGQSRRRPQIFGRSLEVFLMRARRSSIRPLELLPSLLAPRSVVPLYLDPRTRTRRLVVVFGCGARAFCGLRCDGVARGPAGASAGRRGGPKRLGEAGQALRPSFKSWSGVREPCAAGAPGRAPQCSDKLRRPWGLRTGGTGASTSRAGKKRVLLRVREASLPISRSRPTGSLRSCRSSFLAGPAWCKKPGGRLP